jgi:ribosome maturation factor RimP
VIRLPENGRLPILLKPRYTREVVGELMEWAKAHFFIDLRFLVGQSLIGRIEEIAQTVASSGGLEVVEVELKGSGRNQMLRIYIDKPQGVTHADCESVSLQVGNVLDAEDLFPGHYTLEVSSPGVERKLKNWKDFERFQGHRMKVVLREPISPVQESKDLVQGSKGHMPGSTGGVKHFDGVLQSAQGGALKMELTGGQSVEFRFEQVDRANLKFEW